MSIRTVGKVTAPAAARARANALALCLVFALPTLAGATDAAGVETPRKASREESKGVASGLVIGAAAGGPFGAVLGAATGAWFGDRWHAQRKTMLAAQDLTHEFGFRTGSSQLEPGSIAALQQVALLAQRLPGTRVRIVGAADPRGNADYNLALSQRRAAAVADVLRASGIDAARLVVEGIGAIASDQAGQDPDGWAFARRVTVTLEAEPTTRT
jgi:outer membrane protein OmpA-like peptidoglycan-associated protein